MAPETPVASDVSAAVEQMVSRRARHEPVQYIVGGWDFRGLSLRLRPPVFIPRPETEQLVGLILASAGEESSFLEIGCGSGAISLSLLKELPQVRGVHLCLLRRGVGRFSRSMIHPEPSGRCGSKSRGLRPDARERSAGVCRGQADRHGAYVWPR